MSTKPIKVHSPGYQHQTPAPGSKGWERVMSRGCGLYHDEMNGDYDCTHGYTWGCEDCPIAITAMDEQEAALIGPPCPEHLLYVTFE